MQQLLRDKSCTADGPSCRKVDSQPKGGRKYSHNRRPVKEVVPASSHGKQPIITLLSAHLAYAPHVDRNENDPGENGADNSARNTFQENHELSQIDLWRSLRARVKRRILRSDLEAVQYGDQDLKVPFCSPMRPRCESWRCLASPEGLGISETATKYSRYAASSGIKSGRSAPSTMLEEWECSRCADAGGTTAQIRARSIIGRITLYSFRRGRRLGAIR